MPFFFFPCSPALRKQDRAVTVCYPALQTATSTSSSPQPPPGPTEVGGAICAKKHQGAARSHPWCVRQGDRRKTVLSGAAAWFSFVILIAFNNFPSFVPNKSPCQGFHGLPGIRTCCSHVTSICHCSYIWMQTYVLAVQVGLCYWTDSAIMRFLSFTFHICTRESTTSPRCLSPGTHTGVADPVCIYCVYLLKQCGQGSEKTWNAWEHQQSIRRHKEQRSRPTPSLHCKVGVINEMLHSFL